MLLKDINIKEIASLLGINEGTSKSQFSHARKMLQNQINKLKIKRIIVSRNQIKECLKNNLKSN